jgi:hypothetical protein
MLQQQEGRPFCMQQHLHTNGNEQADEISLCSVLELL